MDKSNGLLVLEMDEEAVKRACSAWSLDIGANQYSGDFTEIKCVVLVFKSDAGDKFGELCEVDSWIKGGLGAEKELHFQRLRFARIRGLRWVMVEGLLEANQPLGLAKKYLQDGEQRPGRIDLLGSPLCTASIKTAKEAVGRYYDVLPENVSITISG